jgi:hypothetical protein
LLLRCEHLGYHTKYNLGGVPKDIANTLGIHPTDTWQAAFDRFTETLKRHCVMVNRKHLPRASDSTELVAAPREVVVNPISTVQIVGVASRKRGMGHSYPRARRSRRK